MSRHLARLTLLVALMVGISLGVWAVHGGLESAVVGALAHGHDAAPGNGDLAIAARVVGAVAKVALRTPTPATPAFRGESVAAGHSDHMLSAVVGPVGSGTTPLYALLRVYRL